MAFFNSTFLETALSTAWETRSKELRAQALQPHNDILFDLVKEDIFSRRSELHGALMMVASTSHTPQGLSIPLWSYNAAHYVRPFRVAPGTPEFESSVTALRQKGYRWSVGLVHPDFNLDALSLESEEDWDNIWRWRMPQSVDEIVRSTDFLNRITLLFGEYHFRVSLSAIAREVVDLPASVVVETMEVRLHYYPRGVYQSVRDALQVTKTKYETHVPKELMVLRPFLWTGAVERPTGFSNVSPPRRRASVGPPAVVRRSNCDGVARELFPATPCHCSSYSYESE